MSEGQYEVDLSRSYLYVYTYKAGLLSSMGHDLRLLVPTYTCTVEVGPGGHRVLTVTVDPTAIFVDGAVELENGAQKVAPVSDWAAKEIVKNMKSKEVLNIDKFPSITYKGILQPQSDEQSEIVGELELHGVNHPLKLVSQVSAKGEDIFLTGEVQINQSMWGITPYSAMMGAMKLKDEVRIEWKTCCAKKA